MKKPTIVSLRTIVVSSILSCTLMITLGTYTWLTVMQFQNGSLQTAQANLLER